MCFSPDGTKLATVSLHFGVKVWLVSLPMLSDEPPTPTSTPEHGVSVLDVDAPHHIICAAFSPRHDVIAISKYGKWLATR